MGSGRRESYRATSGDRIAARVYQAPALTELDWPGVAGRMDEYG